MILFQLRFAKKGMCLTRFVRSAGTLTQVRVNPLLEKFSGSMNFKVSAEDVQEAIPCLVKSAEKKFTKLETHLKGMIGVIIHFKGRKV